MVYPWLGKFCPSSVHLARSPVQPLGLLLVLLRVVARHGRPARPAPRPPALVPPGGPPVPGVLLVGGRGQRSLLQPLVPARRRATRGGGAPGAPGSRRRIGAARAARSTGKKANDYLSPSLSFQSHVV